MFRLPTPPSFPKPFVAVPALLSLALLLVAGQALAFPGFFAGKTAAKRVNHETHIVIMHKGDRTVVSLALDYDGPLDDFAIVMPVPPDVTVDHIKTLRREFVDRVTRLTAPRFHEFWETDPCQTSPVLQVWQQNKKAKAGTAFLGGGGMPTGTEKVAPEMLMSVKPEFNEGEFGSTLLSGDEAKDVGGWLKSHGYVAPAGAAQAIQQYVAQGMQVLVAKVDTKKIELAGGGRAVLSPIRFWTEKPFDTLATRLGLYDLGKKQELYVYVMDPDHRYEAKNYENIFPPTNIEVALKQGETRVKERMGEFYNAMIDLMQKKHPKAFFDEYAWSTKGCGQPCPDEPLAINELLTLGADVFEETVPKDEAHPKPPELTDEEKKAEEEKLKGMKPKDRPAEKKQFKEDRIELARRKALIARNVYVLSRIHYRYDKSNLTSDVKIGPADHAVEGGIGVPQGKARTISTEVKPAKVNKLQIRYNNFHPWKGMMQCQTVRRWRWGKPPRTYRGRRKIWVADDLTRKSRTQIDPAKVVMTPVPSLGLPGKPTTAASDAGSASGDGGGTTKGAKKGAKKKSSCGCRVPGGTSPASPPLLVLAALCLGFGLRRRRR